MTKTGHTDVIRQAFKGLDQESLDLLRNFAIKNTYPPNTILWREGDDADRLYVIVEGRVVISRSVEGGDQEFVLGMVGPGGFFGEMALRSEEHTSELQSPTNLVCR